MDERGNVVGVVAAKLSARAALAASGALPENVNYAVKSSFLLGSYHFPKKIGRNFRGTSSPALRQSNRLCTNPKNMQDRDKDERSGQAFFLIRLLPASLFFIEKMLHQLMRSSLSET